MTNKAEVGKLLKIYKEAWEKRDTEKILRIFTKDATYQERPIDKPFVGHKGIKKYWTDKVVGEQENIRFKLKKIYVDGNNAVAEWEAKFHDVKRKVKIHLFVVAILEIKNGKIKSLRGYWHSKYLRW